MNKAICRLIVAGGLGLLPGLHSQSHGMEEGDYLYDPERAVKLEKAWNNIDDLKQRNVLSRNELILMDNTRAFLNEVNPLLEENWWEGEETFVEFILKVSRFFLEETFAEMDPSTATPEQARNAINNIKAMMRTHKFALESGIIKQYQDYEWQKRELLEAFEKNREATKSIPIPHDEALVKLITTNPESKSERLGKGGPPKTKPVLGKKVRVYDENMEIKIDAEGRAYTGLSIQELQEAEKDHPQYFTTRPLVYNEEADQFIFKLTPNSVASVQNNPK